MSFNEPDYNLSVDVYANLAPPPAAPLFRKVCCWVQTRRQPVFSLQSQPIQAQAPVSYLLLKPGVSLKTSDTTTAYSLLRIVGMPGCLFAAVTQTMVGAGHDNEHIQLMVSKLGAWPEVIPSPTPNPP